MKKMGNNHSSLLDQFAKIAAQKSAPKEDDKTKFSNMVNELITRKKAPSLREILKVAQFESAAPPPPADPMLPAGPVPAEGGSIDLEAKLESVKDKVADLLIELCDSEGNRNVDAAISFLQAGRMDGETANNEMGGDMGNNMGGSSSDLPGVM